MARAQRPAVHTIAAHRAFADAFVAGLIAMHGASKDRLALARGIVLLPNNRAIRAVRDAFVRASGSGLVLPRLVAVGDIDLDETLGNALAPIGEDAGIPRAVDATERLMILTRLIMVERARIGEPVDIGEGYRLAVALAQTLDQLIVERKGPHDLKDSDDEALSGHWAQAFALFTLLMDKWPRELERLGCIDAAERRNRLLDRVARKWGEVPPDGFVAAAGIVTTAPAVAGLLRTVARMPNGLVVLPDLDLNLTDEQWDAVGPVEATGEPGAEPQESHPQFALKQLLHRMGVNRREVTAWQWGSEHDARAARGRAISTAMLPALLTGAWPDLRRTQRTLDGVRALEAQTPAEEAQAIAIAMREAIETPGRTAALVTPDRALATRVSAHLRRWGIDADDSAGRPLSQLPPGTLLIALAQAGADGFSPVSLLSLLKHPLVMAGEARLEWLEHVRRLDLVLRGPRPAAGLDGITRKFVELPPRTSHLCEESRDWWTSVAERLRPLELAFAHESTPGAMMAALRDAASDISGEGVWAGYQGHAASTAFEALETAAAEGPLLADPEGFAAMLAQVLAAQAVRPPQGGHPRLQILGLLEARLQQSDLMILSGLNEGAWPSLPQPDPWLAPRIRRHLGLPGLERRIGLSAHDFANGLGAPDVLLTRARRDASAPRVASRFWLRLRAMTGDQWREDAILLALARAIDRAEPELLAARPAPRPPLDLRPRKVAATDVDRLRADPYAFYAAKILGLASLDPVDGEPGPAWRGTAAHDVLKRWMDEGSGDPARLDALAREMLAGASAHPLLRILWQPRLLAGLGWVAEQVARNAADGRTIIFGEDWGEIERSGVTLGGKPDRIDRMADGSLAVVDYKSGATASARQVAAGYSLQLGLLGLIAQAGGFAKAGPDHEVTTFEYWKLAKTKSGQFGFVDSPVAPEATGRKMGVPEFLPFVAEMFDDAAARWLTGDEPFTARPHSDAPVFTTYDHLMRIDEWYGRDGGGADRG